jgi:recombination protein RecR
MTKFPEPLLHLITYLRRLPGVGSKTAERFAFQVLGWSDDHLHQFSDAVRTLKEKIKVCPTCHCLTDGSPCTLCDETKRDASLLCILSSAKDVYAFEETRLYRGLYHVLDGLLSPLDGRTPDHLDLKRLDTRLQGGKIQEAIIALDSTIEGDATALYLKDHLTHQNIRTSRLAFGLPIGSPIDYVDGGTLSRALSCRQTF